ncbi:MAG: iron transporter [Syntrophus sp. (in: bacteria)]|nr:iron transporter [Syntrophus sp. (in: bacteria)]
MNDTKTLWQTGLRTGLKKGWGGFLWIMKIVLPISFLTALLAWSGWLHRLDFLLAPAMDLLSLPTIAALPLIIGMLANIYGAIAAMVVLPFTTAQMTLMGIFLLTAHNLIQEGIIQARSGLHPLKATLFRISAAVTTVMLVAPFLRDGQTIDLPLGAVTTVVVPFLQMVREWAWATLTLSAKIFGICMVLLTTLEVFKAMGWITAIVNIFSPFLKIMGLDRKLGFLWMTAIVFGLAYGGAVIVEETKDGSLPKEDLEMLHLSIGINHSMVEDPALFMSLGLSAFWLYIPRLIMAIVTVRLLRLWFRLRRRFSSAP